MPELPEVQTIVSNLSSLKSLVIVDTKVYNTAPLKNSNPKKFNNYTKNEEIIDIERIGKYIRIKLSHNKNLLFHMRMEGKLILNNNAKIVSTKFNASHLRLELIFNNNVKLQFYDSRLFGTLHIYDNGEILNSAEIKKLGIDVLDKNFNAKYLFDNIQKSNKNIKTFLLDQTKQTGIGNIYCDEILFASKIHPLTISKNLNITNCKEIVDNTKTIMLKSIKNKGTTVSSYVDSTNHSGNYQQYLEVYGRNGQKCHLCNNIIQKIKIGGRGTCFCPKCQRIIK
ncbi:MAG: DNA-formamidopyrimidine glycosylase [Mycoplasmataceae bacterium]|nr:DNA-formamidopyrimidine glycosylase [Mycoplasmataceae bacterium]